jgi:Family of unknown function (DUF6152)
VSLHIDEPRFARLALVMGVLFAAVPPAAAHHSNAIYDLERNVTLSGVVTRYEWANPHVYLDVETRDESGGSAVWQIEASPPTLMARRGWSPTSFAPGDPVTVDAHPARNASKRMALGLSLRTADGATLVVSRNVPNAGSGLPPPPTGVLPLVPASDLSGTWLAPATPDGAGRQFLFGPTSWALTEKAAAAVAGYDDSENPAAECVAYTAPFTMVFPDLKTIALGDEITTLRTSLDGAQRIIHMDVDSHGNAADSNQGHSIGHWEGRTLVVDTARFGARINGNAMMLPSGRRKHLVERFELGEDRTTLSYSFELEDPEYLAEPVRGEAIWAHAPGRAFAAEGCDRESARRYLEAWVD